jgi:hypothetical protein
LTNEQINRAIAAVYGWEADYCTDLNAMHEAEEVLTDVQCLFFRTHLRERLENHPASLYVWHATARQRAEAFLRTLGKWEEVQP